MNDQNENTALRAAEVESAKWRNRVERIQSKIREAQEVLNKSDTRRAEHALAAALSSDTAAAAMTRIRRENENATKDIADLQLALPEAQRHLAAAEQAESVIRKSIARKGAQEMMRERIDAARKFDKAIADAADALKAWTSLAGPIEQFYMETLGPAASWQSVTDNIIGWGRVRAALPPVVFGKLFPTTPLGEHRSLEQSEAGLWNLPDNQSAAA